MRRTPSRPIPPEVQATLERLPPGRRRPLEHVWAGLDDAASPPPGLPDDDDAWAAVVRRLNDETLPSGDRPAHPRRRRRWLLAATLVLPVLVLALGWGHRSVSVTVPPGQQAEVTLPDGSTAHLNSDTRLQYPRVLPFWPAATRSVQLDGEAFFSVEPGDRPFVVETFNARVEVLGTRFNVWTRHRGSEGETWVTLAEGHVEVRPADDPARVLALTEAGQSARVGQTLSTAPSPPDTDPVRAATAWRTRGFTAVDQPLARIFEELQRRYARRVEAAPGLDVDEAMTLLYFRPVTLEEILSDVCVVQRCRYRPTSRGYVLVPAPPSP